MPANGRWDLIRCLKVKDYQERLREMPYVPQTSFRRDSLGFCGDANKLFMTFLFSDHDIGLQLLKDVGLIRSKVQCNSCGRDMPWHAAPRSLHVCGEVQCTRRFTVHSVPCHRRIHRLVVTPHHRHLSVRRHVTCSCLSPGDSGISLRCTGMPFPPDHLFYSEHL
jgi:hypothetical protein